MRRTLLRAGTRALICFAACCAAAPMAPGAFLFNGLIDPSFDGAPNTEYSAWDVFYAPYNLANYPDLHAPNGIYQTASAAGFATNSSYFPSNPAAYWDVNNPTITQTGTSSAFIIGPGSAGNIYSFSAPTSFVLNDTTSYTLGTAVFQFQTEGSFLGLSTIVLRYTDGTGTHDLAPNEMVREYGGGDATFGGLTNRTALQWNLTGLGITAYQILFHSTSASASFQIATLDTSATYAPVVPVSSTYTAVGTGSWGTAGNWQSGALPQDNANARFNTASAATVTLDASRTIGELQFQSAANVTLNASAGSTLTANTGITTTSAATGHYTINANYTLGSLNLFDIEAGTVNINGVVSGSYGLSKSGAGTLVLSQDNTFTGAVAVTGGTLRLAGKNTYTDSTTAEFGNLVVAADAPSGAPGALGNAISVVALGADSTTFANIGGSGAQITIDGDHTVGRSIQLANGAYQKILAAQNTTTGATFSGTIDLNTSSVMSMRTTATTDRLVFSGGIVNGAGTLTIDGPGTVVFSGGNKTYASVTNVAAGTLQIASGTAVTASGNVTVSSGGTLLVQGSLSGSGSLLASGGTIGGSGTISRDLSLGSGGVLSPGTSGIGTLATGNETWGAGAALRLEINNTTGSAGLNWDALSITGNLGITATSGAKFRLELDSLAGASSGLIAGFNANGNYTWQFLTSTNGITGFSASAFDIDTSHFLNPLNGSFSVTMGADSKSLSVQYLAVPEPSAALLGMFGGSLFLLRRRRGAPSRR